MRRPGWHARWARPPRPRLLSFFYSRRTRKSWRGGRNAKARGAFDALAFTHRKEYVVWILDAKKPETRAARLVKTVEMLSS